jgi:hypothetical protein
MYIQLTTTETNVYTNVTASPTAGYQITVCNKILPRVYAIIAYARGYSFIAKTVNVFQMLQSYQLRYKCIYNCIQQQIIAYENR